MKLAGPWRPLNAVATASADGKVLYFKVVNPHNRAIAARVTVAAGFPVAAAKMLVVAPGAEYVQNTLQQPDRIKPVSWAVDRRGQTVAITMPALSAGVTPWDRPRPGSSRAPQARAAPGYAGGGL